MKWCIQFFLFLTLFSGSVAYSNGQQTIDKDLIHTFKNAKIKIESQIDSMNQIAILLTGLNLDMGFEFTSIAKVNSVNTPMFLLKGNLRVIDRSITECKEWIDVQPLTFEVIPKAVAKLTIDGECIYKVSNISIFTKYLDSRAVVTTKATLGQISEISLNYVLSKIDPTSDALSCNLQATFTADGLTQNEIWDFTVEGLRGERLLTKELIVDANGKLIDAKSNKELIMSLGKFARGEPLKCTLMSKGKELTCQTDLVPYPMEVRDNRGHEMSLVLIDPFGKTFGLSGSGFEPNERLTLCSKSEQRSVREQIVTTPKGEFYAVLYPAYPCVSAGKASVSISGKTTTQLKIDYKWGAAALNKKIQ